MIKKIYKINIKNKNYNFKQWFINLFLFKSRMFLSL
jgi:hypothetical protein